MSGSSGGKFKTGDLVFAKMKGFPFWPARVCKSDNGYKKRVPVFYFGTHQVGNVPPENVVPFNGNKTKYGSGVRIKGFSEGMWEIQNTPGICSKLKIPEKQPSGKPTPANKTPVKAPAKSALSKSAPPKLTGRGRRPKVTNRKVAASLSKTPTRATRSSEETLSDDGQKSTQSTAADTETTPAREASQRRKRSGKVGEDGRTSTNEGEEKSSIGISPGMKSRKTVKIDEAKEGGIKRRTRSQGDGLSINEAQETKRKRKGNNEVNVDGQTEELDKKKARTTEEKTQTTLEEEKDNDSTEAGLTEDDGGVKTDLECGETEIPEVSVEIQIQGTKRKQEDGVEGTKEEKESMESDEGKALASDKDEPQKTGQDVGTKKRRGRRPKSEELGEENKEHALEGMKKKRGRKPLKEKTLSMIEVVKSSGSLENTEQDTDQRASDETGSKQGQTEEGETNKAMIEERAEMEKADGEGETTESAEEKSNRGQHDVTKRKTRSGRMSEEMAVDKKTPKIIRARGRRAGKAKETNIEKGKMTRRDTRSHSEATGRKDKKTVEKEEPGSDGENRKVEENKRKKVIKLGSGEKDTTDERLSEGEGTTTRNTKKEEMKIEKDEVTKTEVKSDSEASKSRRKRVEKEMTSESEVVKTRNAEKGEQKKTEDGQRETRSKSEDTKSRRDEERDVVENRREKKRKETNDEKCENDEAKMGVKPKKRKKDAETSSESEQSTKMRGEEDGSDKRKAAEEKTSDIAEAKKEEQLKKTVPDERSGEETKSESDDTKRRCKEVNRKTLRPPGTEEKKRRADEKCAGGKTEKHRDEERQALKRERVLKSLQGLLKAKRGSRKRESAKNLQKAADSRKKSIKNLSSKRKDEKRGRPPGRKLQQERVKVLKEAEKKEEKSVEGQMTEKPEGDQKEDKSTDEMSDGTKLEERKEERKIIGKIVKAGQGGKIQLKTMMGGIMASAEKKEEKTMTAETVLTKVERKDIIGKLERNVDGKRRLLMHDGKAKGREREKSTKQLEEKQKEQGRTSGDDRMTTREPKRREKPVKEEEKKPTEVESQKGARESKKENRASEKLEKRRGGNKTEGDSTSTESDERMVTEQSSPVTPTDSTLHRIHGDIRISLKSDKPDIHKCLEALDQLSTVYVTSQHIKRHSELIATLRKMRYYRASQTIMDKASMLYNRFKNAYLVGEGEEVVSAAFLRSLIEEKEREEEDRVKLLQQEETALCQEMEQKIEGGAGGIEKGNVVEEERANEQQLVEVQE